jgi:hypothetical protein
MTGDADTTPRSSVSRRFSGSIARDSLVREHRAAGESYVEVRDEVSALVEQLEVVAGDELGAERIGRVEQITGRVERLYKRG